MNHNFDNGIGKGATFSKLVFNSKTKSLVVQVSTRSDKNHPKLHSLYFRNVSERKYKRLSPSTSRLSYDDVVNDDRNTFIYTNVNERQILNTGVVSNWDSLSRISLVGDQDVTILTDKKSLTVPDSYNGGWISRILGVSSDGTTLFVVAGLENAGIDRTTIEYWVCNLRVGADNVLWPVTRLNEVFF